jgi:hypothetical protein
MAIGRVSSDIFDKEINGKPELKVTIIDKPAKGRKEGDNNVPEGLRKLIGETYEIDGRSSGVDLAKRFGISPSSASAYANGSTSTTSYNTPVPAIKSHIIKSKERAVKRASVTLNQALSAITQEKLDYADPKDLAGIAKDMAVIIKNLEPPATVESSTSNSPQFTIYAPTFRDERSFEVITVQE